MSELTQCNYCSLQEVKARAKRDKMKVTLMAGRTFNSGRHPKHLPGLPRGVDVFVHPRNIDIAKLRPDQREKFWDRWFWELGDRCGC
jgi:hypothetical protein